MVGQRCDTDLNLSSASPMEIASLLYVGKATDEVLQRAKTHSQKPGSLGKLFTGLLEVDHAA